MTERPGNPKSRGDSTPPSGIGSFGKTLPGTTHLHFWSDVTQPESEHSEQVCNGEKWSPSSLAHVFPEGCGARRRILKTVYAPAVRLGASHPPDSAWELVDPGRSSIPGS